VTHDVHRLLLVDDELSERGALARHFGARGFLVDAVGTGEDAVERLSKTTYDLLITDLCLPGIDGLKVIQHASRVQEDLGSLLITAYASVESAVEALRLGAHDYLLKPLSLDEVEHKARRLLQHRDLQRENAQLRTALREDSEGQTVVDTSPAMKDVLRWARRAARVRSTVLLTGETGTGKEVIARAIHRFGSDREAPFLTVNLAAIPENMLESELFGHERGAFTGADRRRDGILRAAAGGTVFLDEIAELPVEVQAKLLRALEGCEVQPLGSDRTARFEARIIAATHRDLRRSISEGRFREDLFYRLNVLHVTIPPLRSRREDIPPLVRELTRRLAARCHAPVPEVTEAALELLCQHSWRGNVRELSNVLERAVILADGSPITPDELPHDLSGDGPALNLQEAVRSFERTHIAMALRLSHGDREKAARDLGISLATLYRRLASLDLSDSTQA